MKIPVSVIIPREKLTKYLLVPRQKNDKSKFLAQAGFTLDNPEDLDKALRELVAKYEAFSERQDEYGTFFRVEGELGGPRGILLIVTVWILRTSDNQYRFVTLRYMKPELYQEVALARDIPNENLKQGDIALVVDYVLHPLGGEEGVILEIFNAIGESIAVVTVPISAITTLQSDQRLTVRHGDVNHLSLSFLAFITNSKS